MDIFGTKLLLKQIHDNNIINKVVTDETKQFSTVTNVLIHQTLILRENLKYWNKISNSLLYKVYYGIQTFPRNFLVVLEEERSKGFVTGVYDFVGKLYNLAPRFYKMVDDDIADNIAEINRELKKSYVKLGQLIQNKDNLAQLDPQDYAVLELRLIEPSFIIKYWVPIALAVTLGPAISLKIVRNRSAILDWLKNNVTDVLVGFYENWLIKPIKDVVNVIKQDTNIIAAKESLNSLISSLERMVRDYIVDNKIEVNEVDLKRQVEAGDLTLIMSKYENELKSPIKNLFRGTLVRSLLIQIQKTKVDGDLVISGIDKLMKSQQLLLGIVSISPSVFIVYQVMKYFYRPSFIINGKDLKKSCLGSLVGLKLDSDDESRGNLLVNVINLKIESRLFLSKDVFNMLDADLNRLTEGEDTLNKLYVIYSGYFK